MDKPLKRWTVVVCMLLVTPFLLMGTVQAEDDFFLPGDRPIGELGTLLFFTSEHCPYCQQFKSEVQSIYAKTAIGGKLPMVEIEQDDAGDYEEWSQSVWFRPNFVILCPLGTVVGRIKGYQGEEFWWADMETLTEAVQALILSRRAAAVAR
ncbi:MAG: hypothetical protein HQL50_05755 [Magnetococcales bacterium]|nr:hypothetical protein [Magnetococcales bacterium]